MDPITSGAIYANLSNPFPQRSVTQCLRQLSSGRVGMDPVIASDKLIRRWLDRGWIEFDASRDRYFKLFSPRGSPL